MASSLVVTVFAPGTFLLERQVFGERLGKSTSLGISNILKCSCDPASKLNHGLLYCERDLKRPSVKRCSIWWNALIKHSRSSPVDGLCAANDQPVRTRHPTRPPRSPHTTQP